MLPRKFALLMLRPFPSPKLLLLKFIEEQGVTITYPDLTAFEEALAPVTESYCKQYGDEFTALYNQLKG